MFSPLEVAQGLPTQVLVRRFRRDPHAWRLEQAVQERIRYATIDVRGPWPGIERMDLIVVRRVLVYLTTRDRVQLVARLREVLAPDGMLFLDSGDAETLEAGFEPMQAEKTGFYRRR